MTNPDLARRSLAVPSTAAAHSIHEHVSKVTTDLIQTLALPCVALVVCLICFDLGSRCMPAGCARLKREKEADDVTMDLRIVGSASPSSRSGKRRGGSSSWRGKLSYGMVDPKR